MNSIEGAFDAVRNDLDVDKWHVLPFEGSSPSVLWCNLRHAWRFRGERNHMTGDAQYIVPALGPHTLLTIHDVGSAFTGGWFKRAYVRLLWFTIPLIWAKRVSVISQATLVDLLKIAPWVRKKTCIIPDPYNTAFEGTPKATINSVPRILHIGTKPNKNLERTIEALTGMNITLVIIGKLGESQKELLKSSDIAYSNRFDISLEELVEEYRLADIISFPSTFEGFGMPVVEGQAACRPVLAGDIPVLRDVAGVDGALFVDPYDIAGIKYGFECLMSDSALRKKIVESGAENIKRFHPSHIAQLYNNLYKEL